MEMCSIQHICMCFNLLKITDNSIIKIRKSKPYHCCNGSIFLPVPVPVLELIQIVWRFRVRLQNCLRLSGGSSYGSRTDSDFLAVPGQVFFSLMVQFLALVSVQVFAFSVAFQFNLLKIITVFRIFYSTGIFSMFIFFCFY